MTQEIEPNQDTLTATAIALEAPVTGELDSWEDKDYYRFSVTDTGLLTIDFSLLAEYYSGSFELRLIDAEGRLIAAADIYQPERFSTMIASPGAYYLSVDEGTHGYGRSNRPYQITLSHVPGSFSEFESEANNSLASADPLLLGAPVSGQLANGGDNDVFAISVTEAGVLRVDFDENATERFYRSFNLGLLDDEGNILSSIRTSLGGEEYFFAIQEPGTYYLQLQSFWDWVGLGNYRFTVDHTPGTTDSIESGHNSSMESADEIQIGHPIYGQVYGEDDDFYKIATSGPGILTLETDFQNSIPYWLDISLYDAAGTLLGAYKQWDSQLREFCIPSAGDYYIRIGRDGDSNQYRLSSSFSPVTTKLIESETNDSQATADVVQLGATIMGQFSSGTDSDFYQIDVDISGRLEVSTSWTYNKVPELTLYDDYGHLLSRLAKKDVNLFSGIIQTPGRYFLKATDPNGWLGTPYELTAMVVAADTSRYEREPNNTIDNATEGLLDGTLSGQLYDRTDRDYYKIPISASGTLTLTLSNRDDSVIPILSYGVALYDSSGTLKAQINTAHGGSFLFPIESPGTYYAEIKALENGYISGGSYSLTAGFTEGQTLQIESEANDSLATADEFDLSTGLLGSISSPEDKDLYHFTVANSGILVLQFDSPVDGSSQKYFRLSLFDADGKRLAEFAVGTDREYRILLPEAGDYYIGIDSIHSFNIDGQQYRITAQLESIAEEKFEQEPNDTPETGNRLSVNDAKYGEASFTNSSVDVDHYRFAAQANESFQIELQRLNQEEDTYYQASVYSPSGTLIASRNGNLDLSYTIATPESGDYDLQVVRYRSGYYGNPGDPYKVLVKTSDTPASSLEHEGNNEPATATPVVFDRPISGQLSAYGDLDYFRLEVSEPEVIKIHLVYPGDQSDLPSYTASLYSEDGDLLAEFGSKAGAIERKIAVHEPGAYYVRISSSYGHIDTEYTLIVNQENEDPSLYEVEPNNYANSASPLTLGTPVIGELVGLSDSDYFAFDYSGTVDVSDTLTVTLSGISSGWLGLLDSDYNYIGSFFQTNEQQNWLFALPHDGRFYLAVGGQVDEPYQLTANVGPKHWSDDYPASTSTPGQLTIGVYGVEHRETGTIDIDGDRDWFRVDLEEGKAYTFRSPSDTQLRLMDKDGELVFPVDYYSSDNSFLAQHSGSYYLSVSGGGGTHYWVSANLDDDFASDPGTNGALAIDGHELNGEISYLSDIDWLKVSLEAGKSYQFWISYNYSHYSVVEDVSFNLLLPDGTPIARSLDLSAQTHNLNIEFPTQIAINAPVTGDYFLAVGNEKFRGSYTVGAHELTPQEANATLLMMPRWNWMYDVGSPITITFGFPQTEPPDVSDGTPGFSPFTDTQREAVRNILQGYSQFSGIQFQEVGDLSGQIRFYWEPLNNDSSTGALVSAVTRIESQDERMLAADIVVGNDYGRGNVLPIAGRYIYFVLLHEIGHALGLVHPGQYLYDYSSEPPYLPYGFDGTRYTVMSYNAKEDSDIYNTTPGVLDVQALQYMYGVGSNDQQGDTTYTFFPNSEYLKTISDASGIDTIDASQISTPNRIFLTAGTLSSIGRTTSGDAAQDNVAIAYDTSIENALGGSGDDLVIGSQIGNSLSGNAGNDTLWGGDGDDYLDGGSGIDTAAFTRRRSDYQIASGSGGFTVTGPEGRDTLVAIERLHFMDGDLALDTAGNAGQVYRLYKAAFARSPDLAGLGNWIKVMDEGQTLEPVAATFAASAEFQSLYGTGTSNEDFVKLLYLNALGRAPDSGLGGWVSQLNAGVLTRAQVLARFSESEENKSAVQERIADGILYAAAEQATLATQGLSLTGTADADALYGSVGKDTLTGLAGDDSLDGGADIDTAVYGGERSAYTVSRTSTGLTTSGGTEGNDSLVNVERLKFSDGILAFDTDGNAGQVYRLYQAAFARTPDVAGLSDWVRGMDGGMTLRNVATGFIGSAEFQGQYGASPSNEAFVNLLYQNVLHRVPDDGGKAYWMDELGRGMTREMALIGFSESSENQVAIIGIIQGGIELLPG